MRYGAVPCPLPPPLSKAIGAKDYSKLIEKHGIDKHGKRYTTWVLPEDAKQQSLFDGETEGKGNPKGARGYHDHLDDWTKKYKLAPLLKFVKEDNPELAGRIKFKYENYRFDRDTQELDIKHDLDMAWYMRKIKNDPEHKADWQEEYNQKTDNVVKQINNRKAAMLKVKKGSQVNYYGKPAIVSGFSRRGFPVVKTHDGKEAKALWEEVAT